MHACVLDKGFNLAIIDSATSIDFLYGEQKAVTPTCAESCSTGRQFAEKTDPYRLRFFAS